MNDPYVTLGVSPNASDEEIKTAYRNLAKKYHPDNYTDSPLASMASERMKEINEAYDTIQQQRRSKESGGGYGSYGGYYNTSQGYGKYRDVRMLIKSGRIADADQILSGVPANNRDAEWYFLKGTILYRKGWAEEAFSHFQTACSMEPDNMEYRGALNQMNQRRSGVYGGYNPAPSGNSECNGCNVCTALCCADTCCECMGGDLIPCC